MSVTGLYFQWARGRAMVRNRCMRRARVVKAAIGRPDEMLSDRQFVERDERNRQAVTNLVKRARQAHKDYRRYRALHLEFERE